MRLVGIQQHMFKHFETPVHMLTQHEGFGNVLTNHPTATADDYVHPARAAVAVAGRANVLFEAA